MNSIHLRPAEPEKDFGEIAALISSQEDEPTSPTALRTDYEQHKESLVWIVTAEADACGLLGFYWAWRNQVESALTSFYLVVKPEQRRQGVGYVLYEDLARAVTGAQAKRIRVSVRDDCPEGREFAERRGFSLHRQHFGMELDLRAFDDRPFADTIARLKIEGFRFTSMEELGNTLEAQRNLYALNDAASASAPGQEGEHP